MATLSLFQCWKVWKNLLLTEVLELWPFHDVDPPGRRMHPSLNPWLKKWGREDLGISIFPVLLPLVFKGCTNTRCWFQIFFIFTPNLGEDSHFHQYFSNGLKPPTRIPMIHTHDQIWTHTLISSHKHDRWGQVVLETIFDKHISPKKLEIYTPPKTNMEPENHPFERKLIFHPPSIFGVQPCLVFCGVDLAPPTKNPQTGVLQFENLYTPEDKHGT